MSDFDRIWLQPECCTADYEGRTWCEDRQDNCDCPDAEHKDTEYVRADLAAIKAREPLTDEMIAEEYERRDHLPFYNEDSHQRSFVGYDRARTIAFSLAKWARSHYEAQGGESL